MPEDGTDDMLTIDNYFSQYSTVLHIAYNSIMTDFLHIAKHLIDELNELYGKLFNKVVLLYESDLKSRELKNINKEIKNIEKQIEDKFSEILKTKKSNFKSFNGYNLSNKTVQENNLYDTLVYKIFHMYNNIELITSNAKLLEYVLCDAHMTVEQDITKIETNKKNIFNLLTKLKKAYKDLKKLNNKKSKTENDEKTIEKLNYNINQYKDKITDKYTNFKLIRVFGGKKNMLKTCSTHINDEKQFEYKKTFKYDRKHHSILIKGDKSYGGSRFCKIIADRTTKINDKGEEEDVIIVKSILFRPNEDTQIELKITNFHGYEEILNTLYKIQEEKILKISYRICDNTVSITIDDFIFYDDNNQNKIKNRVMSVDLNPDYIGYCIVDWISSSKYKRIK